MNERMDSRTTLWYTERYRAGTLWRCTEARLTCAPWPLQVSPSCRNASAGECEDVILSPRASTFISFAHGGSKPGATSANGTRAKRRYVRSASIQSILNRNARATLCQIEAVKTAAEVGDVQIMDSLPVNASLDDPAQYSDVPWAGGETWRGGRCTACPSGDTADRCGPVTFHISVSLRRSGLHGSLTCLLSSAMMSCSEAATRCRGLLCAAPLRACAPSPQDQLCVHVGPAAPRPQVPHL
jgi:hypothetical protein